jgi:group I intron endonuclease
VKKSTGSALYDAMRSYGADAFTYAVLLDAVENSELNRLEEAYIKIHDSLVPNGYNIKPGGNHTPHSEETKRKIGEKSRGRRTNAGKVFSEEWRKNIGNASRGRQFSQAVKDHLSLAHNQWHEAHPIPHKNCKYTEDDIRYMRANPDNLTTQQLRERFKIEQYRLMKILNRKLYARVKD